MYSVTIGVCLNLSAKDACCSSRKMLFRKNNPRRVRADMPVRLQTGRYAAPLLASFPGMRTNTLAGLSAKDRRKPVELVARFRSSPASSSGKGE